MGKRAILVVDMLNDFVTGALKCDRGLAIVPKTAELLRGARAKGVPVIFCNDSNRRRKGCYSIRKHGGDVLVQGSFSAEPGELRQLTRISCTCSEQALLLIEWEFEDGTGGVNHKVTGMPCYDFDVFRYEWLPAIAALDGSFDAAKVGC